jgi:DNA polymerase III alpha subunit (gram-positive type)
MRILAAGSLIALAGCARTVEHPPAYVMAAERTAPVYGMPLTDPGKWRLAFIDIETTGLLPGYHEMIDCGIVLTDLEGVARDSFFVRIMPQHPERLTEGARRVNGFDPQRWPSFSVSPAVAADSLLRWHQRVTAGSSVLLVTFNSQFDTSFLDALLREQGHHWRELYYYFVLDLPSMAWSLGLRDLTNGALAEKLGVANEPRGGMQHTGLTGAQLDARIYRALLSRSRR